MTVSSTFNRLLVLITRYAVAASDHYGDPDLCWWQTNRQISASLKAPLDCVGWA